VKNRIDGLRVRIVLALLALAGTAFGLVAASAVYAQADPLVLATSAGKLRGRARPGGGAEFLGIPYAQPPLGILRWRPPVPARTWIGVRDATKFGAACMQPLLEGAWNRHDVEHSSEDCLFLNVITPAWPAAKPLPVMVWLHGGANTGGSASSELYKNGTLAEHGVILVTVNYRLGVFGFLAHPALSRESADRASGNYGLMDQILALKWVRANIARFGGDPNNITLFGQSAGSIDTGILMTSPQARGLFQKAIAESGAVFFPAVASLADAEKRGVETAAALNAPAGVRGIAFMRKIAAEDLLTSLGARAAQWPGYSPDVDGWIVPRSPAAVFAAGDESPIPLLLGTTSREFPIKLPPDALRASITRDAGNLAPQALALYGLTGNAPNAPDPVDPLYGTASQQWSADSMFHCPIATEALWHARTHQPVYEYELDHPIPGQEAQGAVHSGDLPYVFGYFPKESNIGGNFNQVDFKLADLIERYWTNFARTGNPNGPGLPAWPRLDAAQRYLDFAVDGSAAASDKPLRAAQCGLYRQWTEDRLKLAH
jgi:para-nitrobenzyl esterase